MDTAELNYLLCKIGKRIFVKYYSDFGNPNISNQEMRDLLPREYTFKSRSSRTSKSRRIFREGLEKQALLIIAESSRMAPEAPNEARSILTQLRTHL